MTSANMQSGLESIIHRVTVDGDVCSRQKRPVSASSTCSSSSFISRFIFCSLPKELWLKILVDSNVSAKELVSLDLSCKWFSNCWGGNSLTEEAARLIIKHQKRKRFGELTNRVSVSSWKEKLWVIERMESNSCTLAAGSYQNTCLLNRQVVSWGAGKFGQLGNNKAEDCSKLQVITDSFDGQKIVQVSAGCGHTGFVSEQGMVFSCGDNRYNQLGHNTYHHPGKHCYAPTRITLGGLSNMRVLQVACGSSHTLFMNDLGKVYAVGQGDSGQLGLGPRVRSASVPVYVPLPYDDFNFLFIVTGIAHNVLLTQCGKVFTFGLGSSGQLGHGGTKNLYNPAQVTAVVHSVKIVSADASDTSTVLLASNGAVYTCGKGCGTLGHGDVAIRTVPKQVDGLKGVFISSVTAGVGRTIFISKSGQGYWCGEGIGKEKSVVHYKPTPMKLSEPLHSAAVGNSHIVLKTRNGQLVSVGSNGRYQTGHNTDNGSPVQSFQFIDTIALKEK